MPADPDPEPDPGRLKAAFDCERIWDHERLVVALRADWERKHESASAARRLLDTARDELADLITGSMEDDLLWDRMPEIDLDPDDINALILEGVREAEERRAQKPGDLTWPTTSS